MKENLEKIKKDLQECQKAFNLVSSRCKYAMLGGNFKVGYECNHHYHKGLTYVPKKCSLESCIVINSNTAY